jgi:Tfp pilus assembly protein PilO
MDFKEQLNKLDMQKCVAIGVGLAAVYYVLLFNSGSDIDNQTAQFRTQIASQQETLGTVRAALEDQKKFEAEIKNITSNMRDFQKYFSQPMTILDLTEKVTAFAEESELLINNLKPSQKEDEYPEYPETLVEFDVEGSFHNIMSFISLLTQMNKAIDFYKMDFETVTGGDYPVIKLKTTLIVYGTKATDKNQQPATPQLQPGNNGGNNG